MKDVAPSDRPREKLQRLGAGALGDNELLAALVGHGTPTSGALALANRILAESQGLGGLSRWSPDELAHVPGIGLALAARILAGIELGRRTVAAGNRPRLPRFSAPGELGRYLVPRFGGGSVERLGVALLDTRCRLIRAQIVAVGSLNTSGVEPREVFRDAIAAGAAALAVFHNHPSGDPSPSRDDVQMTRRLAQAGMVLGIELVDHVILTDAAYFSLREQGWPEGAR